MRTVRHVVRDEQGAIAQIVEVPDAERVTASELAARAREDIVTYRRVVPRLLADAEVSDAETARVLRGQVAHYRDLIDKLTITLEVLEGRRIGTVEATRNDRGGFTVTKVCA